MPLLVDFMTTWIRGSGREIKLPSTDRMDKFALSRGWKKKRTRKIKEASSDRDSEHDNK